MAEMFKYDVAISFLYQDLALAQAVHDELFKGLEVFFFPRNQEELAGTEGLESMREPFRNEARLNVVLYRPKWGHTPWTGVEEAAVKESCLATSYKSIFFFVIEPTDEIPTWLPDTHVRFNYADFTLDQAVGAIKARVQERGGHYKPLTPARRLELLKAEDDFRRDKSDLSSQEGIAKIIANVAKLFQEITSQCQQVSSLGHVHLQTQVTIQPHAAEHICLIGEQRVGMAVNWVQMYTNSLEKTALLIREFDKNLIIPTGQMYFEPPEAISETEYAPDIARTREYGWIPKKGKGAFVSTKDLATICVIQFLDLIEKDRSGKIKRKGWG